MSFRLFLILSWRSGFRVSPKIFISDIWECEFVFSVPGLNHAIRAILAAIATVAF